MIIEVYHYMKYPDFADLNHLENPSTETDLSAFSVIASWRRAAGLILCRHGRVPRGRHWGNGEMMGSYTVLKITCPHIYIYVYDMVICMVVYMLYNVITLKYLNIFGTCWGG